MPKAKNLKVRCRILESALRLFHESGYKGVSMEEVARASGVKKANLFHYYPTKEVLGIAVFDRASSCSKEKIKAEFSQGAGDPIRRIRKMFSRNAASMKATGCCRGCFVGNLAQELSDENEKLRVRIAEHFQFWTLQLSGFLEKNKTKGYFKRTLEPSESAEALICLLEGATLLCKARKQVRSLESAGKMATVYLRSLRE